MDPKKSVMITGASTGIGRTCALELDRKGYQVFAGVRKESDAESLKSEASERLTPVIVDVTDLEGVARAAGMVGEALEGAGLYGLVNNAGIAVAGPLEYVRFQDFEAQMRVNVNGQLAVTQAFLPLIRRARGRIVFMGSESGRFTLPFVGPYSASKHALEAVANAFRIELAPSGVRVSIIEPASIKTPIWDKTADSAEGLKKDLPAEAVKIYGRRLRAMARVTSNVDKTAIPPERVSRAVCHALSSRRPRARYVVGLEAWALILWHSTFPPFITDKAANAIMNVLGGK